MSDDYSIEAIAVYKEALVMLLQAFHARNAEAKPYRNVHEFKAVTRANLLLTGNMYQEPPEVTPYLDHGQYIERVIPPYRLVDENMVTVARAYDEVGIKEWLKGYQEANPNIEYTIYREDRPIGHSQSQARGDME